MKKLLVFAASMLFLASAPAAAETWKGTIADSMCGAKHSAEKHGGKGADHRACVEKCVKGGGEYVFLSGDKLYKIANQSFDGLKVHAGHEVMLTGDMKGETVTVSKIAMPEKSEKK
jgi:hypothetical protein